jgi:hypothetical protein
VAPGSQACFSGDSFFTTTSVDGSHFYLSQRVGSEIVDLADFSFESIDLGSFEALSSQHPE